MERAEVSVFLYNATKEAFQKYGPFICLSELRELTKLVGWLPRLFKSQDLQIDGLEVKMKMPRLTGERNILIVDLPVERNDEITVFAIDDLPAGDITDAYIGNILKQMTGQDKLTGRRLRTASDEEVDLINEEYLNGGILKISSASQVSALEETPLPNLDVQSDAKFNELPSNKDPPPIEDHNVSAKIREANSISRRAPLDELVMNGTSFMVEKTEVQETNGQSGLARLSPVGESDLSQDEADPIRDIVNKSSSSSPTLMPDDFEPFLADFTSESMDKWPEGQEEVNNTRCYELPTAEEIADIVFNDEVGKEKFKRAYYESFTFRERGGWIFVDPDDPSQIEVVLAPVSASDTFLATDTTTTPSIDLNDISTSGVPPDYVLVATFHTHPLYNNEKPSKADIENAYVRGMPGIVISRMKIFGYGPERRTNTDEPFKYAPSIEIEGDEYEQSNKLRNNPFPLQ